MQTFNYIGDVEYHERITRLDQVHHLLGNGRLQAVVQVTEKLGARNALALPGAKTAALRLRNPAATDACSRRPARQPGSPVES